MTKKVKRSFWVLLFIHLFYGFSLALVVHMMSEKKEVFNWLSFLITALLIGLFSLVIELKFRPFEKKK